jgi:UDP-N-acetylmuramoylalanine-D-glutamate ligase
MKLPDDVLIVGLGMTGVATARFLAKMGKKITIVDEKPESDLSASLKALEGVQFLVVLEPTGEKISLPTLLS